MPISKELQKLLVFSDVKIKRFVENYAKAESSVTRLSGSAIIQQHLLNDILPTTTIGREIFIKLYSSSATKDVLSYIFKLNTYSSMNDLCRWPSESMFPFVEFCSKHMHTKKDGYNKECSELIYALKSISIILLAHNNESEDSLLTNTIKHLNDSILLTEENINAVSMATYIDILIETWSILKDSTYTYRALCTILETASDWEVNITELYNLGKLIKEHSPAWDS